MGCSKEEEESQMYTWRIGKKFDVGIIGRNDGHVKCGSSHYCRKQQKLKKERCKEISVKSTAPARRRKCSFCFALYCVCFGMVHWKEKTFVRWSSKKQQVIKDPESLPFKGRVSVLTFLTLKERCEKRVRRIIFRCFKHSCQEFLAKREKKKT